MARVSVITPRSLPDACISDTVGSLFGALGRLGRSVLGFRAVMLGTLGLSHTMFGVPGCDVEHLWPQVGPCLGSRGHLLGSILWALEAMGASWDHRGQERVAQASEKPHLFGSFWDAFKRCACKVGSLRNLRRRERITCVHSLVERLTPVFLTLFLRGHPRGLGVLVILRWPGRRKQIIHSERSVQGPRR